MGRLEGKICVITGGSTGIGAKAGEFFAREGAKVVLGARRENYLKAVCEKIAGQGGEAQYVVTDVRDAEQAENLIAKAKELYGKVDVLVNAAGVITPGLHPVEEFTEEELEDTVNTNFKGTLYVTRAATQLFDQQGYGNIINISSVSAVTGCGGAVYTATKGGIISLTKHIAMRYAFKRPTVRANCVCPGTVWTDMTKRELAAQEAGYSPLATEFNDVVAKHNCPDVGICKSIDIANVLLFLASDESACLTGQVLSCDYGCNL